MATRVQAPFQRAHVDTGAPVSNGSSGTTNGNGHVVHPAVSKREPTPGIACVLALGRALPGTLVLQEGLAEGFFRETGVDNPALQAKLERICKSTTVKTRYVVINEEIVTAHPEFMDETAASVRQRLEVCGEAVEKMGVEAATNCIREWGRDLSTITHLIYVSSSEIRLPGGDLLIARSLGLSPDINRVMLYMLGCYGGAAALRIAKDLAENNKNARVLIVTSETTVIGWRPPNANRPYDLVGAALFGDGAGAAIVGADPVIGESPCFELRFAGQSFVPGTEKTIDGTLNETGILFRLGRELPKLIEDNVEAFCDRYLRKIAEFEQAAAGGGKVSHGNGLGSASLGVDYNDVFWAVHPGGPAILNAVQKRLELNPEKLQSSRDVLRDFGNVNSNTVLYVLDYMREANLKKKKLLGASLPSVANGEIEGIDNPEWGMIMAFGPGITMEGILARNLV